MPDLDDTDSDDTDSEIQHIRFSNTEYKEKQDLRLHVCGREIRLVSDDEQGSDDSICSELSGGEE